MKARYLCIFLGGIYALTDSGFMSGLNMMQTVRFQFAFLRVTAFCSHLDTVSWCSWPADLLIGNHPQCFREHHMYMCLYSRQPAEQLQLIM